MNKPHKKNGAVWLAALPLYLFTLVFVLGPLVYMLILSFQKREVCLRLDKSTGSTYSTMFDMFHAWQEQAARLERGEITKEEYDQWRYKYPKCESKHTKPSIGKS